ncbi:hypothetical protein HK101_000522 [Irineochytrium annulatum]|nr:hypothetical protein HK101_000522 [Irineochytrium annulatum]
MNGDIHYVEKQMYPMFAQSPLLRENPVVAYLATGYYLRAGLFVGERAEVERRLLNFETLGAIHTQANVNPWHCFFYRAWARAILGNLREALSNWTESVDLLNIDSRGPHSTEFVALVPVALVLLVDPPRSGLSSGKADTWTPQERTQFQQVLQKMIDKADKITKVVAVYWGFHAIRAILLLLKGRNTAAVHLLKSQLKSRRGIELDTFKVLKAIYCGIVGKYSAHKEYTETARNLFLKMDMQLKLRRRE